MVEFIQVVSSDATYCIEWILSMLKVTHRYTTWHRSSRAGCPTRPGSEGLPHQNETNQRGENAAGADDALGGLATELLFPAAGDGACRQFD